MKSAQMKTVLIKSVVLLLLSGPWIPAGAQKKPAKKEQLPSQKEMNDMMKEMQQSMNEMSDEDKRMMDSMGIKMPNLKNMQQAASFALANIDKTSPGESFPKRDAIRIAAIPKTPLTKTGVSAYLQSVHLKIKQTIPAALQQKINQQFQLIRSQQPGKNVTATAAVGYWTLGNPQAALLLMSQACQENPSDDNNLNNLAAMLSMSGGEHMAIPILQLLNKQYPKNSTILNNIAHAWFGLGDMTNASKYADSTIRLCAWHPQANQIKAAIEESKGNHDAAVKAAKQAISRMHTPEKERALNDLGYELKSNDIIWGPRNAPDQLGLSKFTWPGIPKSVGESDQAEDTWNKFRQAWDEQMASLKAEHAVLQAAYEEAFQRRMQHDMNAAKTGARTSALMEGVVPKAVIKLQPYVNDLMELEAKDPLGLAVFALQDTIRAIEQEHAKRMEEINRTISPGGEGTGPNEAYCAAVDEANSDLMYRVNSRVEAFCLRYRDRAKKRITEMVNYKLYSEFPEKFALTVNEAKMEWLSYIIMPKDLLKFRSPIQFCKKEEKRKGTLHALPDYDVINCQYRSRFSLALNSIETACGRTIVKIDVPSLKSEWEFRSADREENRNVWDEFQRCTIEVSVGQSKEFGSGPLQLEAKAQATGFLEFDRTGLKDAGIKVEVGVGITTNVVDSKVDTKGATVEVLGRDISTDIGGTKVGPSEQSLTFGGAEATISINSGFTAGGTGILKGVRL
jgi:tetratricopeptide (TPR) repeat protein